MSAYRVESTAGAAKSAIAAAESLLPGRAASDGQSDPRWQAIIAVGEFVTSEPDAVWQFARRWGSHHDVDLQAAIATCVLEHLLEAHFESMLPKVDAEVRANPTFARTLRRCWTIGQAASLENRARLERVLAGANADAIDVRIVDAIRGDAEAILALQKLAYEREARRYNDWTIPPLVETLDTVRRHIAEHVVLKAIVDGRLAGSVRGVVTGGMATGGVVTGGVCEVCRLSVDPALQRRGVGSALIEAIEARFPAIDAFELFTGDRSVENLRLYDRHGYVETHRRAVSPAVSLVYLRKGRV